MKYKASWRESATVWALSAVTTIGIIGGLVYAAAYAMATVGL